MEGQNEQTNDESTWYQNTHYYISLRGIIKS